MADIRKAVVWLWTVGYVTAISAGALIMIMIGAVAKILYRAVQFGWGLP